MTSDTSTTGMGGLHFLVTGGAGRAWAPAVRRLLDQAAHVTVMDNSEANCAALDASLEPGVRDRFAYMTQDLANAAAVERVVSDLTARQRVDVLVNMAAIYPSKALTDYSVEEFAAIQSVNTTAAFACAKAVLPAMVGQGWGRIISVSSITFYGGWSNLAPYVTSKGALIGLTRSIAREFGAHGITANAICPGAFPTEAERIQGDAEAYSAFVLERQAIKRRGRPEDFSDLLIFFASDKSSFITGQSLNLDGGWFMN